jgi:aromatic ring-opening dioxygenase LigB subunit
MDDEILSAVQRINRRNAKKSTGPKTTAGKARASQNALRHGLAIPIEFLPKLIERREQISQSILDHEELSEDIARDLADALLTLERVNSVRDAAIVYTSASGQTLPSVFITPSSLKTYKSTLRYESEARAKLRRVLRRISF